MGDQIIIEWLKFSYDRHGKPLLYDLSATIPPASVFGIVGKNSTGKTTLFDLLLGMLFPDRGSTTIADENGNTLGPGAIGFLPVHPYYHNEFRLKEYLRYLVSFSPKSSTPEKC